MDDIDRQLFLSLQRELPLVPRPFEKIGRPFGLDAAETLLRISRLQSAEILGPLGGSFDTEKLGLRSFAAAMAAEEQDADHAASWILKHPSVFQCVQRSGVLNLWFSMLLPAEESAGSHVMKLQEMAGAKKSYVFEFREGYKPRIQRQIAAGPVISEAEKKLACLLYEGIPVTDQPFQKFARELGETEDAILQRLEDLKYRGILKKIGTQKISREQAAANALVLWQVPEEHAGRVGLTLSQDASVRFCVRRTGYADFSYSLHTAVDSDSAADAKAWISKMQGRIGRWSHELFFKEKEYAVSKIKLFVKDLEAWRIAGDSLLASLGTQARAL